MSFSFRIDVNGWRKRAPINENARAFRARGQAPTLPKWQNVRRNGRAGASDRRSRSARCTVRRSSNLEPFHEYIAGRFGSARAFDPHAEGRTFVLGATK